MGRRGASESTRTKKAVKCVFRGKGLGGGSAAGLTRTSEYTGDDRSERADVSPFQSEESSLFFFGVDSSFLVLSDEDGDDASFFSSWSDGFFPA